MVRYSCTNMLLYDEKYVGVEVSCGFVANSWPVVNGWVAVNGCVVMNGWFIESS